MLIAIPDVLTPDQVRLARQKLDAAGWIDGKVTAGPQSARAKDNLQLAESDPVARELGDLILGALQRNPLFISAALPLQDLPAALQPLPGRAVVRQPRRQRDPPGHRHAAPHPHRSVGDAVLRQPGRIRRRRAGRRGHLRRAQRQAAGRAPGALSVDQPALGPAGHARGARSPRSSGSRAWSATTASARCCSTSTARSSASPPTTDHPAVVQLTGIYHNLIRRWADA